MFRISGFGFPRTGGRSLMVVLLLWLLTFAPLSWPVMPVLGATFTVTKTTDTNDGVCDSDCSLREAIIAANGSSAADTIVLQSGQTYMLTLDDTAGNEDTAAEDDLDVTSEIAIEGQGATIQRGPTNCNSFGDDEKGEFRIFEVLSGGNLTLQSVTVQKGCADGNFLVARNLEGGGIFVSTSGQLTLMSTTITSNAAHFGGGIASDGMATIMGSTVLANTAFVNGGGIANSGTVNVTNSTVSVNQASFFGGGGILNDGDLTITNSTISANRAETAGGGVFNDENGTLEASFVTIANNRANQGGGILNVDGTTKIKNSIVADNVAPTNPNCLIASGTFSPSGKNLATDTATMSCGTTNFTYVPSTGAGGLNLGLLQLNAPGTTATHALGPGSAAVDAASDCKDFDGATVMTDQRGVTRPQGSRCDAGAYEAPAQPPSSTFLFTLQGTGVCLTLNVRTRQYIFKDGRRTVAGIFTFGQSGRVLRCQSAYGDANRLMGWINLSTRAASATLTLPLSLGGGRFTINDANIADSGPCL